jgi:predicted nucleotidyltransferase
MQFRAMLEAMGDLDAAVRILSDRARRRRLARVEREADVREQVAGIVRSHLPTGARAWLIGSLAWGGFGERSDIDLVLEGVDAPTALRIEIAVTRAAQAEVDLLTLDALPEAFRQRVLSEGIALHDA